MAGGIDELADMIMCCRIFGFLLGSTLTGAGVYYYVLEEYKVSNELLTNDIYVCPLPAYRVLSGFFRIF
jgi:hypothetical protein